MRESEVLRAEELQGLWLGVRLRLLSAPIAVTLVLLLGPWPENLFYVPAILLICGVGLFHYLLFRSRAGRPWHPYLLAIADAGLVTAAIAMPNPLADAPLPLPVVLGFNASNYMFLMVAIAAFTLSPRLAFFNGFAMAAAWSIVLIVMISSGEVRYSYTLFDGSSWTTEKIIAAASDPYYLKIGVEVERIVILLLLTLAMTELARRSRAFARRRAEAVRARSNLERYFPPNLVSELAEHHQPFARHSEARVAVMFADLVGFTRMAESAPPAAMLAVLQKLHGVIETTVFRHGGTLNKFLGDGAMATFGTPRPGDRDAVSALACAFDLQEEMASWNVDRQAQGVAPLRLSIGLHYGNVVMGDVGSQRHLEFAVLGDTVNLAARLEEATRAAGCTILVSEALVAQARKEDPKAVAELLPRLGPPTAISVRGVASELEVRRFPPQARGIV